MLPEVVKICESKLLNLFLSWVYMVRPMKSPCAGERTPIELHILSGKKKKEKKRNNILEWSCESGERRKNRLCEWKTYLDGYHGFDAASRYWAMSSVSPLVGSSVRLSAIKLTNFSAVFFSFD